MAYGKDEEPVWITEQIREGIRKRKELNRKRRNATDKDEKEQWKNMYEIQKSKTQDIIREEIYKYEEKIAREIKESKDSGKNMWKYINKLKGGKEKENDVRIYGEDGKELERCNISEEIEKFWNTVYKKHESNILCEVWNSERKKIMKKNMRK